MNSGSLREIATSDGKALKRFVSLERELLGSYPQFVSEFESDAIKRLSGQSAFFDEMAYTLFVASDGGRDVARCAALINGKYQRAKNEAVGFIGNFAAAPDCGTLVQAMFERAEDWLEQQEVTRIIGPYDGSAFLDFGLLTSGFDEGPMFPLGWHPPYYADYFLGSGYEPTYPLWYYTVDFSSDEYRAVARSALENDVATIRSVEKKQWDVDLEAFRQIYNEAFLEEWEIYPHTIEEFHEILDPLKPILDTRQILLAEVEGKPVGFCFGVPDLNPLFRSFKGKLGPIQIIRLLISAGRYRRAGLFAIGVLPEYRGSGLAQALAITLYRQFEERGLKEAAYYIVNESNIASRRFAESMGGKGRIMYQCYDKRLG